MDSEKEAHFISKAPQLASQEYTAIQQYLNMTGRPHRTYNHVPHPPYSLVLPPAAKQLRQITLAD